MKNLLFILLFFFTVTLPAQTNVKSVIDNGGHAGLVNDLIPLDQGRKLLSISDDKTIRIWNVESATIDQTIWLQNGEDADGRIYAAAIDEKEQLLFLGGFFGEKGSEQTGNIKVVDLTKNQIVANLKGHSNVILDLEYHKGKLFSACSDGSIGIWNVSNLSATTGQLIKEHTAKVNELVLSEDGNTLISVGNDNKVNFFTTSNNWSTYAVKAGKYHGANVISLSNIKANTVYSGDVNGKIIKWASSGTFLGFVEVLPEGTRVNEIVNLGNKIVAFSRVGVVYDVVGSSIDQVFDYHTNSVSAAIRAPFDEFNGKQGTYVYSAGGDNKNILLWNADNAKPARNLVGEGKSVFALAVSGKSVAFGQTNNPEDLTKAPLEKSFDFENLKLNQAEQDFAAYSRNTLRDITKNSTNKLSLETASISTSREKDGDIRCYTYLADNQTIAVGSSYSLKLFKNGQLSKQLEGHNGEIWAVSPFGTDRLVSASNDQTIRLWNTKSGELLVSLFVSSNNEWVIWTPKGYYDASAGGEKFIGALNNRGHNKLAKFNDVASFRKQFLRPDVIKDMIKTGSFAQTKANLKLPNTDIREVKPPVISWVSPSVNSLVTTNSSLTVKLNVKTQYAIKNAKLLMNGRPIATMDKLTISGSKPSYTISCNLGISKLRSFNSFQLFIEDSESKVVSEKVMVKYQQPQQASSTTTKTNTSSSNSTTKPATTSTTANTADLPKLYLISIGVSKFKNPSYNLNYCDDDAKAIYRVFKAQEGKLFSKVAGRLLVDEDATREKILSYFRSLKKVVKPNDVMIIFWASHGMNVDSKFYVLPHDANGNKPHTTCVDWSDFSELVGNLPAQVLVMIDACHSGQLGTNVGQPSNTQPLRELAGKEYGVVIMAGSTGEEYALEHPSWGHGAFTKSVVEAIEQGKADIMPDGTIYLRELDFYTAERVKALTKDKQHPTTQKPSSISRMKLGKL